MRAEEQVYFDAYSKKRGVCACVRVMRANDKSKRRTKNEGFQLFTHSYDGSTVVTSLKTSELAPRCVWCCMQVCTVPQSSC